MGIFASWPFLPNDRPVVTSKCCGSNPKCKSASSERKVAGPLVDKQPKVMS